MSIYFDFKTIRELIENNDKNSMHVTRRVVEETYDFSPDDWA